ncbi:hypothetical protein ESZ91_06390 [Candidatus Borkfalkia ceftriaxoniphila]|uniref:Uncharacterized protein n=1 Tax=Candidatus Borkfalkia ceftriaxoniphila TaxID=2508949 RepID=A0A4Q2KBQ6_9FIRM|nr:hypothetical protein [Candidatus Borkfalkia ceftriaxoniphila]RXZ62014.1 hypothetical protein ESZ91_06390 [Candidatus Borkfalkia ceftriaxoniphila]
MLKKRLAVFALAAMCLMLAALPQIMNKSLLFKKGTSYTLYAGSVSSNARMIVCGEGKEFLTKLFTREVTGESAAYADKGAAFFEAERLETRFLIEESAAGVTNYYGYSPRLSGGVTLFGERINVHVAVSERGSAIGSPLIFGGY